MVDWSRWDPILQSKFGDKSPEGSKKACFYGSLASVAVALYYAGFTYWAHLYPEKPSGLYLLLIDEATYQRVNELTGVVCVFAALYSAWAIFFRRNFMEAFGMYFWVVCEVVGCLFGGYWKSLPFFILLFPLSLNCYRVLQLRPIHSLKDLQYHILASKKQ